MRKGARAVVWTVLAVMTIVTLVQWVSLLRTPEPPADAGRMLYEVSLFQVELLGGFMGEAAQAASTDELNGLKQAAYSVEYTHSRLVRASKEPLPELHSVSAMMELIVRFQIGGVRKLKADEAALLTELAPYCFELHDAYTDLYTEDGALSGEAVERIRKADEEMAMLLGQRGR